MEYNIDDKFKQQQARVNSIYSANPVSEILSLEKSANDYFQKGGKSGYIGEEREFGGRMYVKTPSGWKYKGKGTGTKAKEHVVGASSGDKVNEHKKDLLISGLTMEEHKEKHDHHSKRANELLNSRDYDTNSKVKQEADEHADRAQIHYSSYLALKRKREEVKKGSNTLADKFVSSGKSKEIKYQKPEWATNSPHCYLTKQKDGIDGKIIDMGIDNGEEYTIIELGSYK